jgi:parallel beta-helix repeat protein
MDLSATDGVVQVGPRHSRLRPPIVAALLAAGLVPLLAARLLAAPIEIVKDTVWEGTVDVSDDVRVLKGATLLIQPGTTVRFASIKNEVGLPTVRLLINGSLIAQGTADRPITFTSAAKDPRPGDWAGIFVESSNERPNRLRHVSIRHAFIGLSGMHSILMAEDTVIRDCATGLYAFQEFNGWMFQSSLSGNDIGLHFHQNTSFHVENCEISGNSRIGILCVLNSSPRVRFCTVSDNGESGVHLVQGASPLIEGNTIRGNRRGISMELQTRPWIVGNLITKNGTGIWGEKMVFPRVEGNIIADNGSGIYCNYSAYMEIHGNNLHDNGTSSLVVGDNMSILMQEKIPFRFLGKFSFDAAPPEVEKVPHQSRRLDPFPENAGVVDARANWWGAKATAEMEKLGENGNISVIEDFYDKPDTYYQDEVYRRDRVAFSPWEKAPLAQAGPQAREYSGIGGKVIFGGQPVAGVRVHAYRDAEGGFRGEGYAYSSPTAADGSFSLNISEGTYYLLAKNPSPPFPFSEPGSGAFFGYFEGNPVAIGSRGKGTRNLQVVRRAAPVVTTGEDPALVVVEGVVLGPAGPVAGASITVHKDAAQQFRGPGLFGPPGAAAGSTDAKGAFSLRLPPGTYYFVASKPAGGDLAAPPRPGDLFGYFDGNPLSPEPGTKTLITIQMVEGVDPAAGSGRRTTGTP